MDRIINDRKKQLGELKHILKMQDLLEQYNRQNAFLNHQVESLLRENTKLKQVNLQESRNSFYCNSKHIDPLTDYYQRSDHKHKNKEILRSKKSKYEYLFEDNELKDIKLNIKKQIIDESSKKNQKKQHQQIQTHAAWTKTIQQSAGKAEFTSKKLKESKTLINNFDIVPENKQIKTVKQDTMHKNQKQKLTQFTNSRIYNGKQIQQQQETGNRTSDKQIYIKDSILNKQAQIQQFNILQQSFGAKSNSKLYKKITIIEGDLPSYVKQVGGLDESRMSSKLMPLSIQSKQMPKTLPESKDITQNMGQSQPFSQFLPLDREVSSSIIHTEDKRSIKGLQQNKNISQELSNKQQMSMALQNIQARTQSKPKRNHSLNPSPKIQITYKKLVPQISEFCLLSQDKLNTRLKIETEQQKAESNTLNRNLGQKSKRKFIKLVSNAKLKTQQRQNKF